MKWTRSLILVVMVLFLGTMAYGWGPNSHGKAALKCLSHSTITPYLIQYGLDAQTIANMAWELDLPEWKDTYHSPAWPTIRDRLWLTDPKWNNLDESRRLAFLLHLANDSGVPVDHDPAGEVYQNLTIEGLLEARVETWGSFPNITPYTGTYSEKMTTFYNTEISLATWCKNNLTIWNTMFGSQGKTAGWSGLTNGQNLGQAMLLEYFQTRGTPEPATVSLLAVGGLALLKRRRK